jgi:cellulose synthase/poly-beta-1,6-N-acetylglucosamine synthase-like glycosyltransferase
MGAATLGLTWVVYPGIVFLLSTLVQRRNPAPGPHPPISVVLATREDERIVRRRVKDLLRTTYPAQAVEIVVAVDIRSPVARPDVTGLGEGAEVRVVDGRDPGGKAATLNAGVAAANGEILVFADSRQTFEPDAISELVAAFEDSRVGGASGNLVLQRPRSGVSLVGLYWEYEKWLRSREARIGASVGVTGAISAIRASAWRPLPDGLILDDVYTPVRLGLEGYRVAFVAGARALETRAPDPGLEYRRKVRTQTGVLQLCALLPKVLIPWRNPLFFPFLLHKIFRLLTPVALLALIPAVVWYVGTVFPEAAIPGGILAGLILLWAVVGVPKPGKAVRRLLLEGVLTQAALLKAISNALRGEWDVWA